MRKLILLLAASFALTMPGQADDDLTRIQIRVTNEAGKPIDRAAVIVKFVSGRHKIKMTKINKAWEMRTSQEGWAKIPAIPKGDILIQVIAKNYQTFGEKFEIEEDERTIEIALKPPQAQYSVHQ